MQGVSKRGKLMPKNLKKVAFKTNQIQSMVGSIKPYHIRYKSLKPKFKIDPDTFRILSNNQDSEEDVKGK